MKKLLQGILITTLFLGATAYGCCAPNNTADDCCYSNCCGSCCLDPCDGYPFLAYRSQSVNAAREISGWQQFINRYDMDVTNGALSITAEYTRSFRPEHIANFFFGKDLDNCNTLIIQGSQVAARNKKAWLADYFGLSPEFNGRVTFCPRIQNAIVDLNLFIGLDELAEGLFFKIHTPITWTKWKLNMCESIKKSGIDTGFDAGYMAADAINRARLADSFKEAMSGTVTWGDMKEAIKFGRMTDCKMTKVRLADIHFSLGWNFKTDCDYHVGFFLHAAAPTGNRPRGCYLFEPIVGNGKHWELGGGLTSSYIFWRDCACPDRYMGLWLEATITHLFKTCQCRSFDFCNKPNSRYMLLAQMGTNDEVVIQGDVDGTLTAASYKYKNNLIPAINWSTFPVDVQISAQADIALKLGYVRDNWSFDLGYNLWARTGEKFCIDCCDDCCDSCCGCPSPCPSDKKYAVKGDAYIYGQQFNTTNVFPLSASQNNANIHTGKNYPAQSDEPKLNPRIDKPFEAFAGTNALSWVPTYTMNTSINPVLVSSNMLNMGKSPSAITHKIFGSITYAWKDCECGCDCDCCQDWIPFFGIGGEIEFAQKNKDCCDSCCYDSSGSSCNGCCDDCCDTCKKAGVHQYGLWIKGGLSFD